ncbi:MAG: hypothetical protein GF329_14700 [Candidatus Lokiarchaeota archaeon]|nr:hypothetical protein [Candidatus Lokiarchaeota archaeon]
MTKKKINLIEWISETIERDDYKLFAAITKLENGLIFILSSKGFKFGTLSISVPHKFQVNGDRTSSTAIPIAFGKKNDLITKALGERVSQITNQMVLAIVNIDQENKDLVKDSMIIINKLIEKLRD